MADIVNLRLVRKRKARSDRERLAEQNRALRGRSKADIERGRDAAQKAGRFIEGHRREPPADPEGK